MNILQELNVINNIAKNFFIVMIFYKSLVIIGSPCSASMALSSNDRISNLHKTCSIFLSDILLFVRLYSVFSYRSIWKLHTDTFKASFDTFGIIGKSSPVYSVLHPYRNIGFVLPCLHRICTFIP